MLYSGRYGSSTYGGITDESVILAITIVRKGVSVLLSVSDKTITPLKSQVRSFLTTKRDKNILQ